MKKLKLFLTFFFLVSVILNAQALDKNNDAKKLYNQATRLRKSGNFQGALEKYNAALKLVDDYRLHFGKAQSYRQMHKYQDAVKEYEIALKQNPDYFATYFYLGFSYFALKNYEKAKQFFEETLQRTNNKRIKKPVEKNLEICNVKLAFPFLLKGQANINRGEYSQAIKNFKKVLEYYDSDAAYLGLANASIELGNYKNGLEYASKAIAHRKTIPQGSPYFFIGLAYKKMGQPQQAMQNFKLCLRDKSKANKGFRKRAKYEIKQLKG